VLFFFVYLAARRLLRVVVGSASVAVLEVAYFVRNSGDAGTLILVRNRDF